MRQDEAQGAEPPGTVKPDIQLQLAEYSEVNYNLRHYSALRFQRLNVFLVAISALSWASLYEDPPSDLPWILPAVGLVVTIVFWVMVARTEKYYAALRDRGWELERLLKFRQLSTLPSRGLLTTKRATHLLFLTFVALWLLLLLRLILCFS